VETGGIMADNENGDLEVVDEEQSGEVEIEFTRMDQLIQGIVVVSMLLVVMYRFSVSELDVIIYFAVIIIAGIIAATAFYFHSPIYFRDKIAPEEDESTSEHNPKLRLLRSFLLFLCFVAFPAMLP